jgi:hypothetical protein
MLQRVPSSGVRERVLAPLGWRRRLPGPLPRPDGPINPGLSTSNSARWSAQGALVRQRVASPTSTRIGPNRSTDVLTEPQCSAISAISEVSVLSRARPGRSSSPC